MNENWQNKSSKKLMASKRLIKQNNCRIELCLCNYSLMEKETVDNVDVNTSQSNWKHLQRLIIIFKLFKSANIYTFCILLNVFVNLQPKCKIRKKQFNHCGKKYYFEHLVEVRVKSLKDTRTRSSSPSEQCLY